MSKAIFDSLGYPTVSLSNNHDLIKDKNGNKTLSGEFRGKWFSALLKDYKDLHPDLPAAVDSPQTGPTDKMKARFWSFMTGHKIEKTDYYLIGVDVDKCDKGTHPLLDELNRIKCPRSDGCDDKKFSHHYYLAVPEAIYKTWGGRQKIVWKEAGFNAEIFIGKSTLLFGPGSGNKVKHEEFYIDPENPIVEAPDILLKYINERIEKLTRVLSSDLRLSLSSDAAVYMDRPGSRTIYKMGPTYEEYLTLLKQYYTNPNNNTNTTRRFEDPLQKDKVYKQLSVLAKKIHYHLLNSHKEFVLKNGSYHPDNIGYNQGCYMMMNNITLKLAIDPSVNVDLAIEFLEEYNKHFSAPFSPIIMTSFEKHMFEDTFKASDYKYGKETLTRWYYDADWEKHLEEYGLIFTTQGGAQYYFVLNVTDKCFYLLDYDELKAEKLGEDLKKSLEKAAQIMSLPSNSLKDSKEIYFVGRTIRDIRKPFGVDFKSRKPESNRYYFNEFKMTDQMDVMINGLKENPDDFHRKAVTGVKLYGQTKYREAINKKIDPQYNILTAGPVYIGGKNERVLLSRVPRKTLRITREIFGCYSSNKKIRKEGRKSLRFFEMLMLYRAFNRLYDTGLFLIGDSKTGKDMLIERLLVSPLSPVDSTEIKQVEDDVDDGTEKPRNNAGHKLTRDQLIGKSNFTRFLIYHVLHASDVLPPNPTQEEIHEIVLHFKKLLGTVMASVNDKFKIEVQRTLDLLLVITSQTIIPTERGIGRISVFRTRTRGNLVEFKDGVAIRERQGKLYNVPWVAKLRFANYIGPLPDDPNLHAPYHYSDNALRKRFRRVINPEFISMERQSEEWAKDPVYSQHYDKCPEYVDDPIDEVSRDMVSNPLTGGKALGEWLRFESYYYFMYLHYKYMVGKNKNDKNVEEFKQFSPEKTIETSALKEAYERTNPMQMIASLVGHKEVKQVASKLVHIVVQSGDLNTIFNAKKNASKFRHNDELSDFGDNGNRLYLHNVVWWLDNGVNRNKRMGENEYSSYMDTIEDYMKDFECDIEYENNNGYVVLEGLKDCVLAEVKRIKESQDESAGTVKKPKWVPDDSDDNEEFNF